LNERKRAQQADGAECAVGTAARRGHSSRKVAAADTEAMARFVLIGKGTDSVGRALRET
jgi:hypothetical protein